MRKYLVPWLILPAAVSACHHPTGVGDDAWDPESDVCTAIEAEGLFYANMDFVGPDRNVGDIVLVTPTERQVTFQTWLRNDVWPQPLLGSAVEVPIGTLEIVKNWFRDGIDLQVDALPGGLSNLLHQERSQGVFARLTGEVEARELPLGDILMVLEDEIHASQPGRRTRLSRMVEQVLDMRFAQIVDGTLTEPTVVTRIVVLKDPQILLYRQSADLVEVPLTDRDFAHDEIRFYRRAGGSRVEVGTGDARVELVLAIGLASFGSSSAELITLEPHFLQASRAPVQGSDEPDPDPALTAWEVARIKEELYPLEHNDYQGWDRVKNASDRMWREMQGFGRPDIDECRRHLRQQAEL